MRDARARNSAMVIRSPLALARRPWPAKEDVRQHWSTTRARAFVRVDACHRFLPAFDTDQARCSNWLANAAHRGALTALRASIRYLPLASGEVNNVGPFIIRPEHAQ